MNFPDDLPARRVTGVRLKIEGAACYMFEIVTDEGCSFFGGPIRDGYLTAYDTMSVVEVLNVAYCKAYLPSPLFVRSITLHHQSANGNHYTLQQFEVLPYTADDLECD